MTTPQDSIAPPLVVGLIVIFAMVGAFAGYEVRGPPATTPQGAAGSTLSVTAAGTLGVLFPQVADALANDSPGVQVPSASQQYEGSLLALNAIAQLHQQYDVAAAADYRLIPRILENHSATWEVAFASTPEALAYDPSASALSGINTNNWAQKLESPGVLLGIANASTDPNGYNMIFALQLQGLIFNGSLTAVYSHFFQTPPGSLAVPNPSTTRVEPETQAALLLSTHVIQAFIIYQSYAIEHHLSYVTLDPRVGLGSLNASSVTEDAFASTSILTSVGTLQTIVGAPVLFSVTVPTDAPNAFLGTQFVSLLLSSEGTALILANGFSPVSPGWLQTIGAEPSWVGPETVPMPSYLPPAGH